MKPRGATWVRKGSVTKRGMTDSGRQTAYSPRGPGDILIPATMLCRDGRGMFRAVTPGINLWPPPVGNSSTIRPSVERVCMHRLPVSGVLCLVGLGPWKGTPHTHSRSRLLLARSLSSWPLARTLLSPPLSALPPHAEVRPRPPGLPRHH